MIDKREILEATSSFSLGLPSVVEKDYILGWILAGINAHEELADTRPLTDDGLRIVKKHLFQPVCSEGIGHLYSLKNTPQQVQILGATLPRILAH